MPLTRVPRQNNNITHDCHYHVVWCPKYRRRVLTHPIQERFKELAKQVCSERNAEIISIEAMPDHIHLVVSVDPQYGIHRLVKQIKGRSSRVLRIEYPELKRRLPTLWTNSYFVATTGGAPIAVIRKYVESQKNN